MIYYHMKKFTILFKYKTTFIPINTHSKKENNLLIVISGT